MLRLLITCLVLGLSAVDASATQFFVATTGSDSNTCGQAQSVSTPKLTPIEGCKCLSAAGDRLTIKAGTYSGANAMIYETTCTVPNGTAGNPTIIEGEGSQGCAITHTCSTILKPSTTGSNLEDASYVTWRLMEIDGTNNVADDNGIRLGASADLAGDHIVLEDLDIHHHGNHGVFVKTGLTNLTMSRLSLHHNGRLNDFQGHGCYCGGDDILFEDGDVYSNGGVGSNTVGIQFYTDDAISGATADRPILRRTKIHDNQGPGLALDGDDGLIYNNLIYGNASDGVQAGYTRSLRTLLYNNTIYGNAGYGIYVGKFGDASNSVLTNNHVIGNGTNIAVDAGTSSVTQTTNRSTGSITDCTVSTSDFSPNGASSSCNDAGTTVAAVTADFIGTSRPQNGTFDIGAYEYIVTASAPGSGGRMSNSKGLMGIR